MKSMLFGILAVIDHTNGFIWFYWLFAVSLDTKNNAKLHFYSSDNSPVIVGGAVGTCVSVIIGVVLALFVIRYALKHNFVQFL